MEDETMTEALSYFRSTGSVHMDWKKNNVQCLPLARLLFHLIKTKEQGIILFTGKRRKMNVIIRSGMITEVQSNYIREDTLGRYLIQQNVVTPEQNDLSLEKAQKMKLPQGQVLVTMNILKQRELITYVSQHKMRKFLRIFQGAWEGAGFEYLPQNVEGLRASMEPVSLKRMLKLGILKITGLNILYETFLQNRWHDLPIILTAGFNKIADLLRLNTETFDTARWLENRSLLEVEHSDPDRFDQALRTAYLLIIVQGARLGDTPKGTIPTAQDLPEEILREPTEPTDLDVKNLTFHQALSDACNFFEHQDYRLAKIFLEKAVQLNPGSSTALAMLAWAEFQLTGKKKEPVLARCKDLVKQAIRIDPNNDKAHCYLGKMYQYENRNDLAVPHFRRALIINPRNEEAKQEIALLKTDRKHHS